MTQCPDYLQLSALAAGAYDELTAQRIRAHAGECERCRTRLAALGRDRDDFLRRHPFEQAIPSPAPASRTLPFRRHATPAIYALAACLALCAGVGVYLRVNPPGSIARVKGDVSMHIFVQGADGSARVRADSVYHPGERIQFTYSCDAHNRFVLLGIDQTGAITTYYPSHGDSSIALEAGRDLPLPNSIVLDNYVGRELYVGMFSAAPLYVPTMREALARSFADSSDLAKIRLRPTPGAIVTTVLITKAGR